MARIGDTERLIWEQHATITDLRARLSAAEAERDYWQDISAGNENVAANFRAKLAEVNAERDATITDLRARLSAAEAERDYWQDISAGNENVAANFRAKLAEVNAERDATITDLRARLAEVEADRDAWFVSHDTARYNSDYAQEMRLRAEAAEARLAAVLALCSEYAEMYEMPSLEREACNLAALRQVPSDSEGRPQDERHRVLDEIDWGAEDECDAEDDWCFTHDRKHLRCYAAGGTARPAEDDDVCMKPHAGDPDPCDCGYPGERSAGVDTEEDHDAR